MNFVEEIKWRGMLHQMMPGTEELFEKEQVTAYVGIDPTADSLHIGHLCGVMMLRHLQRAGHKPIALVGGATGMIGDPSGKSQERNLLDEETLAHNVSCIKKQLAHFLDFESDAPNRAELVNNYDWMKDFKFLDFARDIGKHITVNYMMAKESVQKRLNGEARDGLSFTEFTYQLLQGYDFLHLYQTKNCKLQMGGSDQWGNITTGTELIRRTLGRVDPVLQDNKAVNLALAAPKINGILIRPGETFSFWHLVGRPSAANGYRTGMVIANAQTGEAVGGGMCQFSNLIHWMVLHAPLTITEQHHHDQFDLFPDFGRQVPFGTGTSIFYNYLDYRFRNDTEQTYQLLVHTTPTHLCGELRTDAPLAVKYHIAAENERFMREDGVVYRCGEVYRTMVDKTTGNVLSRELLRRNHARVLYDTAGLEIMDR